MADTTAKPKDASRRSFIKIGAGVVAGAAIATAVEIPYYSSVIGGNSSSSSTSVASLQSQLSSTQEQLSSTAAQLSSTAAQLNAAQGQVTSLNNQLSSTAAQLTSANSQLTGVSTQLSSTQQALTSANGQISTLNTQVSSLSTQVSSLNSAVSTANSQASSAQAEATALQTQIDSTGLGVGFIILNPVEALEVEALAESMIPSDSNGPGAKEAGAIYFIDSQLSGGNYGFNAKMYMQGPFVQPNITTPVTVRASSGQMITYSGGTPIEYRGNPYYYQHPFQYREFWRSGLAALEVYSNSAYGGNFETLSAANQAAAIADCWAGKPTNFTVPTATDFISEVQEMVWAGFITDPIHGGNKNMVGWSYVGYNGQNEGNFYGEGYTTKQLMVMSTPVPLKPASLGQLQKGSA